MKIRVLEEADDFMLFEVVGEDQSFLGMLTERLNGLDGVQYAGYRVEHPLTGVVSVSVKVDPRKTTPRKAVMEALKELKDLIAELEKQALELR
ncbi:MAG: DNA-directed RNA polymerase subunit L [Candidatus Caldarchaeum sp.]